MNLNKFTYHEMKPFSNTHNKSNQQQPLKKEHMKKNKLNTIGNTRILRPVFVASRSKQNMHDSHPFQHPLTKNKFLEFSWVRFHNSPTN